MNIMCREFVQRILETRVDSDTREAWPGDVRYLAEYAARLQDKLAAAEKIFNHFGGLSELSKWENAGGETAANVVQEYLEL